MRIAPWKLVQDEYGHGQYYRHRYGVRAIPEWWTWSPGNIWDFICGNMYADLKKEKRFKRRNKTEEEKHARFQFAIVMLQKKRLRRDRWKKQINKLVNRARNLIK